MPLKVADWHDILKILHESRDLWSAGLSFVDYCRYQEMQMAHPWFKRRIRFLVYCDEDELKAGCKVHTLNYASRGKSFSFLGVSAVFTLAAERNKGYAHELIREVIELAVDEGHCGLILYSEIGEEFYESFGFEPLGSIEFDIEILPKNGGKPGSAETPASADFTSTICRPDDAEWMVRQYSSWLRREPFGLERTPEYLDFKIKKENFLHHHSALQWPLLELHKAEGFLGTGYALTEQSDQALRIFEIIGHEPLRREFWNYLIRLCIRRDLRSIRGWEAVTKDLAPTYKLPVLPNDIAQFVPQSIPLLCAERDWGRCMAFFFDEDMRQWLDFTPCPMLEFDHL